MARQSSLATALRALVMLSSLVVLPSVAVSGKSLPRALGTLFHRGERTTAEESTQNGGYVDGLTWRVPAEAGCQDAALHDLSRTWPAAETSGFREMEQRLRQFGATHCVLESWGHSGGLYRFCCRVAVAGSPHYTRHFEATGPDPLSIMQEVVARVEAWRAAEAGTGHSFGLAKAPPAT